MEPEIDVSDGMKKTSPSKRTERRNFSSYPGKNKKKPFIIAISCWDYL
jgi:hypothetical protein